MKRNSFVESKSAPFTFLRSQRALLPFIAILCILLPVKSLAQDVQVLLRAKMDPLPPQVMNYISNPANYFEVSLTNNTDEVQNVFLTLEIAKQTGAELSVTSPYYIQPNTPITLAPKKLTIATQVQLLNQFRQLNPQDVALKGAEVSDFYDNGVIGLLPEGTYQAHMKVYKWDPSVRFPQLVSDPLQGKCTFSVCYSAAAPEILVPLYNSLELKNNAVGTPKPETPGVVSDANDAIWQPAILDPTKAQFTWKTPTLNCGGKARSYKYQLDIYPIGTTMTTPEQAVAAGSVAKSVKNLVAAQCILSEAEVIQMKKFSATGYFVARVTATPTVVDKKNADYSTVENDGHSQLLVFRLKQDAYGKGGDKKDEEVKEEEKEEEEVVEEKKEEEKKEVDPGYKEPDKNSDKKFVYYPPKLTEPKPFKGNVIKADEDIAFKWEKPEKKSGGDDALTFTYNVKVFKKKVTQEIEDMLESTPIFEEKSLSATNYTLRWDDIKEKVKLSDNLVVAVVPVCTDESSVGYDNEDERNLYRGSYVSGETGKLIDCDPDAAKEITNRTLAKFNEKEIRNLEVMCGKFPLTIENANIVDGDHYEGKGVITWKPMGDGLPFLINVTFDKLYINSDKVVYDGEVVSAKEEKELNDYIPYDMFDDLFLADLVGAGTAEAYGDKLFEYIENDQSMAKYCEYAREVAPIIDDIINQRVSVNLPVSLTKLIPSCPVDIQIMSGRWSATNASVSIIGMFALGESKYTDSQVAVFGLPRLCIEPDSFVPSGCTIALLSDFSIKDPSTQFVFTLKAPSDLQKMDDGCTLSFTNKGFQEMRFEADMEIPGLIKADEKGNRLKGERPHIDIKAVIKDWDDWLGKITMDNFEVEEAPGFTFVPTGGGGLIYDHSPTENDKGFSFPKPLEVKGGLTEGLKAKTYDKTVLGITSDEEEVKWQGLYLDKIGVYLPPIFKQGDGDNRIEVAMKQFLWDDSGVSLTITAGGTNGSDLVGIETGKLGGWGISLREVGVSVIQNDFGCTYFTGMLRAPLIGGKWNYSTSFDKIDKGAGGNDLRILFHMEPAENPKFDFLLAEVDLNKDYTHLDVEYLNSSKETKVELEMAGNITIAGTEELTKKLDFNIPGIAFTGMRVANFEKKKGSNNKSDAQNMKFSHTFDPICEGPNCWFEMGTWGLASAEKTLGPFKFSLDNFGVANKTVTVKNQSKSLMGINIVGTIGLVGDVFSATAGVTIWADVNMDDFDITYYETTLDKIGLSTEFGGCKVAGELNFVEEQKDGNTVKGYSGTLDFQLPGDLFKMKAAGGFFDVSDKDHGRFTSAYFLAEVGGASGIPIGPVQLNNIMGGFFFHTSLDMSSVEANETDPNKWKTEIKYGTHGGMFGLGISTVGTDRGLNAKVRMTVLYDAEKNRLSTFRMTGDMHALCAPGAEDGMINAKCCIVYQNMPTSEGGKYFQINITADAGGDMDKMYEQFTGQKFTMPECVGDLQEMRDQGDKKSQDAKDTKPKVSCGVNITIDFKVTMKADDAPADFKSKWHLYVGQPGDGTPTSMAKDRCSITFIDFQLGGKKDKVAAWCKIWANAYLCIGNELPNNGQLPPIPQEVDEFLNGSKKNSTLTESGQNKSTEADKKRKDAVSQFDGSAKSGVMFGASVGGDFGVRAVICYAKATLIAGFDVVLKQLEDAQCNGKPAGGKGGFYGMGQVYAMAKGEMGLIIDLWIYKGDWSLIDVGVGALLKGGFPNPSWMYGKVKAKCKLFGGLIKFTGSLTFEIGDVCFPDAGNPLDDIKIFEDMTPGEEHTGKAGSTPSGWNNDEISVFAPAGFTTNMKIGTRLDLIDENTANRMAGRDGDPAEYANNAMRSYKFYLEPTGIFESWSDKAGKNDHRTTTYNYRTSDQETYEYVIKGGVLDQKRYYKVTQRGYCKEIRNGSEVDPVYNDESTNYKDVSRPWRDTIIHYFRTGSLPNNLMEGNQIAFTLPQVAGNKRFYKYEMEHPEVHLRVDRAGAGDDIFDTSKYDLVARFEKKVNGNWVPVDAVVRVDTYKSGNSYYYVDENGQIDYTIKVNSLGEIIETQVDPFENKNGYTYKNQTYKYIGVNRERLQRFNAMLSTTMKSVSETVGSSKAAYFYPLKWIPTGFNSIEKAIEYYVSMIETERQNTYSSSMKTKLYSSIQELNSLKKDLQQAMEDGAKGAGTRPEVRDADIPYVYLGAGDVPLGAKSLMDAYLKDMQKTYDSMQRCLNDGEVNVTIMGQTTTYKNRHELSLYYYQKYVDKYYSDFNSVHYDLISGFGVAPTTQQLNELKALYLKMKVPLSKIGTDYKNAEKVSKILDDVKKQVENVKNNYTKDIRNPKNGLSVKQSRLKSMNGFLKQNFDSWRKQVDIYPEYYMSKQVVQLCDAYNDSLDAMTKYVAYIENTQTVKTKATELENYLKQVNAYLEKTPEASRSYSYVNSNYYSKAKTAFETAKKATNHGSEFDRAKTTYNAIESAIFSSEKMTLDFAKEQEKASNTAYSNASTAVTSAVNAANATATEMGKTSSSNDNAAKVQDLRGKEEQAYANAYNKANAVADIAADVQRYTARHTGDLNQSSGANQMRQIVTTCKNNAEKAMKNYKDAVAKAEKYRLKVYYDKAISTALYNTWWRMDSQIGKTNTSTLKSNYEMAVSHCKTVEECRDVLKEMNSEHIYYNTVYLAAIFANNFKSAAYYLQSYTSNWNKLQAAYQLNQIAQNACTYAGAGSIGTMRLNDEEFGNLMARYAKRASESLQKITLDNKASYTDRNLLQNYKTQAASSAQKAETNAAKKKGMHMVMAPDPVMKSGAAPLYAEAHFRSTVPGVAEAFELMAASPETPETPETPDGPVGAAVVAKVAGMMNASLPKPKPKPAIPAESVINNASAMLNGGAVSSAHGAGEAAPDVPTVSGVSGPPANNPYSSAASILTNAYSKAGKTTTANANTSGATTHVDAASLAKSTMATIPVRFNTPHNKKYQYLSFTNLDMYKSIVQADPSKYKNYDYRIVIMQVDKVKFQAAQLESKKETEHSSEEAELDKSNKAYLTGTGTDGTSSNSDTYSLQAYMANYYKEMEKLGLEENEGEAEKTKLKKQKISYKNFASEIFQWDLDFYGYQIYDNFATWANDRLNANATSKSPSQDYLDWQLEGVRPKEFAYYNNNYSPTELAKKTDYVLLRNDGYILYDPYVWLAYMGGFALFNGQKIASKSGYWDKEFGSPNPMTINFYAKSSPYRWKTSPSIDYTNTSSSYSKAAYMIRQIGVGYYSCTYNECRAEKINQSTNKQNIWTAIDDITDMLEWMYDAAWDFQFYYKKLWDKSKSTIRSEFSKWNSNNTKCGGGPIKIPAIQVGFVYQSQWLTYNSKGSNEYLKYFPGYSVNRYNSCADGIPLSHQNYKGHDERFHYSWYCNNMKYVKHEFYRCNNYNINDQVYSLWSDDALMKKYSVTKQWNDPMRGYGDKGFTFSNLDPAWK